MRRASILILAISIGLVSCSDENDSAGGLTAPASVLQGRVIDAESGAGITAALVTFNGRSTHSGANGAFAFRDVEGAGTVTARKSGYSSDTEPVSISENPIPRNVTLRLRRLEPILSQ
jgi:hypothetical protein